MDLSPEKLVTGYIQGYFPMADEKDGQIYWYNPDPRAILPIEQFHLPKRLMRTIKQHPYKLHFDRDFSATIEACAEVGKGRQTTWIDERIKEAYIELHRKGVAHSVEAWKDDRLVGGLYGVALNGFFAGESMFSHARDASKICLARLVTHLWKQGFSLLDVQFQTEHLKQFGVIEIAKADYLKKLAVALESSARF